MSLQGVIQKEFVFFVVFFQQCNICCKLINYVVLQKRLLYKKQFKLKVFIDIDSSESESDVDNILFSVFCDCLYMLGIEIIV